MSKSIMPAWFARHLPGRRGRADSPPALSTSPASCAGEPDAAREPERLERIACYARAGYFNMGYTPDMYPFVGDLPPH